MRRKGSPAEWEGKRMTAANMFEQGLTTAVIAAVLEVDDQTVRRWRRQFEAGGRDALRSRKHPGRTAALDEARRARLADLLLKTPVQCGFAGRHLWTQQLIAELIAREFGVTYHHDHVGVILKGIGFTHQKPARRAVERDEQRVEAWRREAWPALLKKASTPAG
ncbi:MAG: IS630 family transposase [Catenulispora sp.]